MRKNVRFHYCSHAPKSSEMTLGECEGRARVEGEEGIGACYAQRMRAVGWKCSQLFNGFTLDKCHTGSAVRPTTPWKPIKHISNWKVMLWDSLANPSPSLPCSLPALLLATRTHTVYIMFYINLTLNTQVWQTIRPTACSSISPKAFINCSLTVLSPAASPSLPLPLPRQAKDLRLHSFNFDYSEISGKMFNPRTDGWKRTSRQAKTIKCRANRAYLSRVYPAIAERYDK